MKYVASLQSPAVQLRAWERLPAKPAFAEPIGPASIGGVGAMLCAKPVSKLTPTPRIDDDLILKTYALLTRRLGRVPAKADLQLARREDVSVPSERVTIARFGSYPQLRVRVQEWCARHSGYGDVATLLESRQKSLAPRTERPSGGGSVGYVYLIRHGARSEYKIGRTLNALRREGEIRLELPEKLKPVHYIATDDAPGVEAYWHGRFAGKRKGGEWFALSASDVAAFKRWKRIW